MKSFGAKVKEQRGNLGLSSETISRKSGMYRTITSYELGKEKLCQVQLYKLGKGTGGINRVSAER